MTAARIHSWMVAWLKETYSGIPCFLKVCFTWHHFYKRPTLLPVFVSWKKTKKNFCFYEKRWKEKGTFVWQAVAVVLLTSSHRILGLKIFSHNTSHFPSPNFLIWWFLKIESVFSICIVRWWCTSCSLQWTITIFPLSHISVFLGFIAIYFLVISLNLCVPVTIYHTPLQQHCTSALTPQAASQWCSSWTPGPPGTHPGCTDSLPVCCMAMVWCFFLLSFWRLFSPLCFLDSLSSLLSYSWGIYSRNLLWKGAWEVHFFETVLWNIFILPPNLRLEVFCPQCNGHFSIVFQVPIVLLRILKLFFWLDPFFSPPPPSHIQSF